MLVIETKTGQVRVDHDGSLACSFPESDIITGWSWWNTEVLSVFWGDKQYLYCGVPFSTVHAMMNAESLGKFLNAEVKPKYEVL
jgi:hypothetical protein